MPSTRRHLRKTKPFRQCRHWKQKCDSEQPCHNCVTSGVRKLYSRLKFLKCYAPTCGMRAYYSGTSRAIPGRICFRLREPCCKLRADIKIPRYFKWSSLLWKPIFNASEPRFDDYFEKPAGVSDSGTNWQYQNSQSPQNVIPTWYAKLRFV